MTSAEFAESQGFSRPYVTKLVQQGVIVRDANGHIDRDAAVAALAARRDPAKGLRRGRAPNNGDLSGLNGIGGQTSEALSTLMLKSRIRCSAIWYRARAHVIAATRYFRKNFRAESWS